MLTCKHLTTYSILQTLPWCRTSIIGCHTYVRSLFLGMFFDRLHSAAPEPGSQAYDMSKLLLLALTPHRKNQELSVAELATAGFLSAVPTTIVTAPVERAKVLLQVS